MPGDGALGAHLDRPSDTAALVCLALLLLPRATAARFIGRSRIDSSLAGERVGRENDRIERLLPPRCGG
jgi:hypothetical protein